MKYNSKFFNKSKTLSVDKFFNNVLYDKKVGYYNSKFPFGKKGDFLTAPNISIFFSEMIAIWIVSAWEVFGQPKNISIVELGPGDGTLMRILINVLKRFPKIDFAKNIYLYETSDYLKRKQKNNLSNNKVVWIKSLKEIKKGPVIFFGNEFFDAIPIKQFIRKKNKYFEKNYRLDNDNKINEIFKKATKTDIRIIKSFKTFKNQKFIELPKLGLQQLEKITKVISKLKGCILIIDYGYLLPNNQNTLQSVIRHRKNPLLKNLGKADVTSHVNFALLREFFLKRKLKVKKTVTQKEFLENMGILQRAEIVSKEMKFKDKTNLYLRLRRLLSTKLMGKLFKVILAYNFKKNNFYGFK